MPTSFQESSEFFRAVGDGVATIGDAVADGGAGACWELADPSRQKSINSGTAAAITVPTQVTRPVTRVTTTPQFRQLAGSPPVA
ncbi:hypothetical protein Vqi01_47270 [Micromonospora qiuiae]|uniref:Uncharacterized protein n=1 Tax=Micromonospora qiuiae TaxID=502268 RepID=A0ABQ4JJD3_9ACTN|nr:hypothetical protein Vqi01_47270 [Micromonospora qiuiae]